ncbi:unnamed protein product [Ilex paraguariensis]|uniref:Uncharacterized protein n=1 Tax=Ilex paraguariensis TaxID=185542 RepID=A0ABC8QZM7_9AQUA
MHLWLIVKRFNLSLPQSFCITFGLTIVLCLSLSLSLSLLEAYASHVGLTRDRSPPKGLNPNFEEIFPSSPFLLLEEKVPTREAKHACMCISSPAQAMQIASLDTTFLTLVLERLKEKIKFLEFSPRQG